MAFKTMKATTTNNNQSLENSRVYLKLDSRIEPIEIKKSPYGYRGKEFLNDFTKQITDYPVCFLELNSIDPEPVEFQTKTSKVTKRTVFHGYLKPGRAAKLGINFRMVLSEIWQDDTKTFSYGATIDLSKREVKEVSEETRKLFELDDKPGNDKPRKKKGGK
jgi:hypothetical protein